MSSGKAHFIAAGICLALAAFCRFALIGYGASAFCLGALAALLAVYGLLRRWDRPAAGVLRRIGHVLLAAGLALFVTAEVPVLEHARSDEDTDAPYLIVMGAAVHGTVPSRSMTERLTAALGWLEAHPEGAAVVSGGRGDGEDITEARAMADWLSARGVDPARILLEPKATTSYENIRFSLEVIRAHGGDSAGRIALCSSEYHLHRCCLIARSLGCDPAAVAARTVNLPLRINYILREGFALWKCWLFGVE